jgi:hypothetical protein
VFRYRRGGHNSLIQGAAARDVVTSFGPGVCVSSSAGQPVSNATQVGLSYIGSFFLNHGKCAG